MKLNFFPLLSVILLNTFYVVSVLQAQQKDKGVDYLNAQIFGKWVSSEDKNAIIIIKKPNIYIDIYGKDVTTSKFKTESVGKGQKIVTKFTVIDTNAGVLEYELLGVNAKRLSLMYLNRGNILLYNRKK